MMFKRTTSFNVDISKWNVPGVTNLSNMFYGATSFNQTLCGIAWLNSTANTHRMFLGSKGRISSACLYTTAPPPSPLVTTDTRRCRIRHSAGSRGLRPYRCTGGTGNQKMFHFGHVFQEPVACSLFGAANVAQCKHCCAGVRNG